MSKSYDEEGIKFLVQCYKGKKGADGVGEQVGRVCSLEILPKNSAHLNLLENGREESNTIPYLPSSIGRLEFI